MFATATPTDNASASANKRSRGSFGCAYGPADERRTPLIGEAGPELGDGGLIFEPFTVGFVPATPTRGRVVRGRDDVFGFGFGFEPDDDVEPTAAAASARPQPDCASRPGE